MKAFEDEELKEKLDYLDLNLKKIPKFIKDATVPSFNISGLSNDKDLKVYKFVPIDKIEILFTPYLRSDNIKKKYSEAVSLKFFLNSDGDEEEVMMFKTFAKLLRNMSIPEIEKMEKFQNSFEGVEPFKVKYNRDHLWQIYYSEVNDKYFMLVCLKEDTFPEFFYLLKKQIEFSKSRKMQAPSIYVPLNYMEYSQDFFTKTEITDIENYLWTFTKNWPLIFEVYDDKNVKSLQIIGKTFVYKNIKSDYKVVLKSTEEAVKFYQLVKALFIMQTEIKGQYKFDTKIDSNNGLNFYLSKVEITYESLESFVKNEFLLADYEIKNQNKEIITVEKKLEKIKEDIKEKEEEYLIKQKEISTYLECKKTFFGKVKYFFKSDKKSKKKIKEEPIEIKKEEDKENVKNESKPIKAYISKKDFYTIEDLVTIFAIHEKGERYYKSLSQDLRAQELKLENLNSKVKNANLYIEEIDNHKRSIFDFWKFANKDEKAALEIGEEQENETKKKEIKKIFDIEMDFSNLGDKADRIQRKKLSIEEMDSCFIAQTEIIDYINKIRLNELQKDDLEKLFTKLKNEFDENGIIINPNAFDIFGNLKGADNRVKYIGSRSHRETEKNKFTIMNINKKIDIFDFTEKIQSILNYLDGAIPKIKSIYDMTLYKLVPISKTIEEDCFEIFNINVENELKEFDDDNEGAYNLIALNYKEGMPIIYYTNSIFYDNENKTLPIGMNLSSKVLIDNSRLKYELVNKTKFTTNSYFSSNTGNVRPKSKDIFVYEYDVYYKDDKMQEDLLTDEKNINKNMNDAKENVNINQDLEIDSEMGISIDDFVE